MNPRDMTAAAFRDALYRSEFYPDDTGLFFYDRKLRESRPFSAVFKSDKHIHRRQTLQSIIRQRERVRA